MIARLRYYLASIPTLLAGICNWPACATLPFRRTPLTLRLRNGLRFQVRTLLDVWIIKETCLDRNYETHGAAIQAGWVVVDIGAALGDFAILTALEQPDARIFAYEPSPETFAILQENLALNGSQNVFAFPLALAATRGPVALARGGALVQHSTVLAGQANTIPVQAVTLEDVLQSNRLERCDFLKMDCEGGEFDVLLNTGPETLARFERICLEFHDGFTKFSHTDLARHLQQNGYQVKITPNPVHKYLGFLYAFREPLSHS